MSKHSTSCPSPLPPSIPERRGGIRLLAALGALLALGACTAPGMKLNARPGRHGTTTRMDGLDVTLRALDAQAVRGQGPRPAEPAGLEALLQEKPSPYRVGPQDVLLVTVWDHPELSLPLGQYRQDPSSGTVVNEAGEIFFPHVGTFKVAGMTTSQLRETLTTRLARVLQNPQIDVKVVAFRSQKIYVGGEVRNPAVYNVTDVPFTLAEAIHRAGGFLPVADDSRMVLTRGKQSWRLDFQALTSGNRIGQILLKDGDALQVPSALENPVYMLGELLRPGTLPMIHGNLSLAKALSDAGGIQGVSADARSIYVIRQGASTQAVDVYHLDARNPTSMVLADNFQLNPRDIVYVDAGTLVRFNRVMGLLLPTVSAVNNTALSVAEADYFLNRR